MAPGRSLRPARSTARARHYPVDGGLEAVRAALEASPSGVTLLPACPLMHGTGNFPSNTVLAEGGRVCLLESREVRPGRDARHHRAGEGQRPRHRGRPLRPPAAGRARCSSPGRWDLSSLVMIISSGAMWSEPVKQAAAGPPSGHAPGRRLQLVGGARHGDVGLGGGAAAKTASFTLGPDVKVLTEDGRPVEPGLRRGRRPGPGRAQPARLLQGRGEVGPHLQGDRRRALLHPGRLRPGRAGRDHPPAGPGVGLHQLGRREDLPRGGRGGAEDARRGARRRRGGRARTRRTASRSWPWSSCIRARPSPPRPS